MQHIKKVLDDASVGSTHAAVRRRWKKRLDHMAVVFSDEEIAASFVLEGQCLITMSEDKEEVVLRKDKQENNKN